MAKNSGGIILDASLQENQPEALKGMISEMKEEEFAGFTRYKRNIRRKFYSVEEMDKLREDFSKVIVQDFEDDYHMPKAEREAKRRQYEKFYKLMNEFPKKIRRPDVFVEACRVCMDIIYETADRQRVFSRKKFIKKAIEGKIVIEGLNFPKLEGKSMKRMNKDTLARYIVDTSKDPRELLEGGSTNDLATDENGIIISQKSCLTDEELEYYLRVDDEEAEKFFREGGFFNEDDHDYYHGRIATYSTKKMRKTMLKVCPTFKNVLKDMQKSMGIASKTRGFDELTENDVDELKRIDQRVNRSDLKYPKFKGSMLNEDDVNAYCYALDEYNKETTYVLYNGRYITESEKEDIEFKSLLDRNGWNIRNLYGNKEKVKRQEKLDKLKEKRIKKLKEKLKRVKSSTTEEDLNIYGEKYESSKKKNKKKSKKEEKKRKKAKKKVTNGIILDAVGAEEEDMRSYMKRMQNMKWGA